MKVSERELSRRRAERSSRFLVTGATGFVGSHIAVALLRAGYPVTVLCRPTESAAASERFRNVLNWHGCDGKLDIDVVQGDVCLPMLGLSASDFEALAKRCDEVVHCASNTSFLEKHRAAVYETNVGGTVRVLDLAEAGSCAFVHYVSTAYAVGICSGMCRETVFKAESFNNPYEGSKSEAELLVTCRCAGAGIGSAIYRPSIIIGDSGKGRTMLFNAMYYPIKMAYFVAANMREDIDRNGGDLASALGVKLDSDGRLYMPIRLEGRKNGVLNIVPIDFVVDAFCAILGSDTVSGAYHLTNNAPTTLEEVTAFSQRYFNWSGLAVCTQAAFERKPRTALEQRFDRLFQIYQPYMNDRRRFDTTRAAAILDVAGVNCPPIDYTVFKRCIDYAVECNWTDPLERL